MRNPHLGSSLKSAFSDEEWEDVQKLAVAKIAKTRAEYPWCVYILENADRSKLYTGITNDLPARVETHNAGKGAKATRPGRPWKLVWRFLCQTKREAAMFEVRIKKLPRTKKLTMVRESQTLLP
jgi:putative endonuclease